MKFHASDWVNVACVCLMIYLAIAIKLEFFFIKQEIENNQCVSSP